MANTDFSKTRNDFQQYDLVTVFKASETRIMRHLHVATMAVVTKIDGDTIQCMPFPIREETTANTIYAFNIGNVDYEVGDKVLVIFTDRDFRKNYASATTSERSIGKTNDAQLHSIDYGVVMPMTKAYEGSLEALKEKIDKHINDYTNPHNVTKEQVGLGNVVNQGMDITPTKGSEKYISSGGVYDSIEKFKTDLNAISEAINQIEKDYATKDYVVGNFANKYDTNKAIESVSTKATNNETEINNIKNDYLTKVSADSTYAKASDVNKSIDSLNDNVNKVTKNVEGLNTSVSNVTKSVADITKEVSAINTNLDSVNSSIGNITTTIDGINTTLATKQDNLSFGNGINNTNNSVTIDFAKVQAKVNADNGILFLNNVLSIDTSIIPTIEYINSLGYAKASDIPTKVSQLTNDSGYVTESYVNTNFATIDSTNKAIDSLSNSIQSNASAIESIKTDYATNEYVNSTFANATKTDKAIDNLGSRMTTAESNIADRYTKGESDGKYAFKNDTQDTIRQASYSPENLYDINPFLFNNLANLIERGGSAECYNSGGSRIKSSADMAPLFRFGNGTFTTIYITDTTNGDFCFDIIIKSPENYIYAGVLSVFLPSYYDELVLKASAYWGYSSNGTPTVWNAFYNKNGNTALNHHGMYSWIQQNNADTRNWFKIHFEVNQAIPEIRVGLISYAPYDGAISYFLTRNGGTIYDKIQGSITNADHASVADTYNYACSKGTITSTSFDNNNPFTDAVFGKNYSTNDHLVVARSADQYSSYFANSWSSGIFWNCGDTWEGFSVSNRDWDKKIRFVVGGIGGNGGNPAWTLDLITNDNISSQVVKSFTATEIDHGDRFDGDLSSTTCSSAPMMMTTGKLTDSSANEPSASKTTKTRDIRIGGTTKSITCPMNPFMEYFFDHGYHFDTVSTSSSYECDAGLVVYKEDLYYCVFSYKDSANNGFVTYPVSLENNVARLQSTPIAVSNSKSGISFSYDEIKAVGSLYECLGEDKNKAYNVYLVLDSRPPIPLTFNEKSQDFLTADGDSCLDFPEMKGVLYETY